MANIFDLFRKSKQEKLERALELSRSIDILKSEIFSLKREFEEIKRSNENKLGILQNKATISKSEEELNINKSISERIEIRMRGADVEYEKEIVNKTRDIYLKKAELAKILKDSVVNDLFKSEEEKRQIGDSYELITQAYKQEKVSKEKFKEVRKKAEKKLDSKVYYSDIIVTNKKGEILLLKRNENDDMFPGKYCLPGGHIDPGEEGIEAAQRELQEETLIEQSIKKFQKIAELDKEKAHIEYFVLYLDETPQGITLNSREHSSYEWVSKESLEDYDTIGDLQDVFVELGYGVNNHIEIEKAEKIKGGLADGKTVSSIAKKHKVTEDIINEQVKMGVKVEMEHTDNEDKAKEIVLDHLMESPKYYTLLAEMEKKFDKSEAAFTIIQKAFQEGKVGEDVFLKAQKVYKDNAENKKLGRVGKPWGKSGEEETKDTKGKKEENDGDKNKTIEEHARAATNQELEGAAAGGDEELRVAAKKEIERRETEHKSEEGNEYVEKFRSLSDEQVKFYIEAPHSKIKEAAKIVADERGLSVISKEDYIKQFEDYSDKSDKDISDFYKEENKLVKGKLSLKSNEKYDIAVNTYMGNGFVGIRFFLNDPDNFEENVKNHYNKTGRFVTRMDLNDVKSVSNDLSEFIEDNKISKDLVLHRMVLTGGTFFTKLKEGDIYEDKSFSSSSLKKLEHFGDFDIKILAKKGSNVSSINNPGEAEFLINKNSKFRVVEKHKDGLGITVELL